jgi:hypothetical protein
MSGVKEGGALRVKAVGDTPKDEITASFCLQHRRMLSRDVIIAPVYTRNVNARHVD